MPVKSLPDTEEKFNILLNKISDMSEQLFDLKKCFGSVEDKITILTNNMDVLCKKCDDNALQIRKVDYAVEAVEQYTRRNNLRVFGIPEEKGENTDQILMRIFEQKLGVAISFADIEKSHRLGKTPAVRDKGRPIIVRFASYRTRATVFSNKKKLKGSGITVREDLTKVRIDLLQKVQKAFGTRQVWTVDGKIFWVENVQGKLVKMTKKIEELHHILQK